MRSATATLSAVALVLGSVTAHAAPTARLVYSRAPGAESCADEEQLRRAIASRIGYDPFFPWANKTIVASMSPSATAGFVASVNLVDEQGMEHGARALRTDGSCGELLDAAALAIAIAIDPLSLTPKPAAPGPARAESTAPAPLANPVLPVRPEAERVAIPVRPTSPPVLFQASAGVAVSAGVAPLTAVGFSVGAAMRWRRVSLGLEGRIDVPASAPATGGGNVSAWLAAAALLSCGHAGPLFLCAVGQLGSVQVRSERVTNPRSDSVLWMAAGGRFGVEAALTGDTVLRVRSDVVGDLGPTTLQLNSAKAWQAPLVASSLGADVVVRF